MTQPVTHTATLRKPHNNAVQETTTSRPLIGICTRTLQGTNECACVQTYINAVIACNATPLLLPGTTDTQVIQSYVQTVDGIIIPGGGDVNPAFYNEPHEDVTQIPDIELDEFELELIRETIRCDKPLFGICRGYQIINVALGGTLYQDIQTQLPHAHNHSMEPPYNGVAHPVRVLNHTPLFSTLERHLDDEACIGVNSRHHQASKALGEGLMPMAYSDDGICEAFYLPSARFVQAVQWHPELMFSTNDAQAELIQSFVDACN